MSRKSKQECCHHEPQSGLTRRQFLGRAGAAGVGFSFTTISPVLYSLMCSKKAYADNSDPIPVKVIAIHLSGGWAGFHAFAPRDEKGNIISGAMLPGNYGIPSNQASITQGINTDLGAPIWWKAADGTSIAGPFGGAMLNILSADAKANTFLTTIPNQSPNDNTPGATYGVTEAIASILDTAKLKPMVAHSVGLTNSPSGNGVSSFVAYPSLARVTPQSVQELLNVTQFSRSLGGATTAQFQAFAKGISSFMQARLKRLGSTNGEQEFNKILSDATINLTDKVNTPTVSLNPGTDTAIQTLLGLDPTKFDPTGTDANGKINRSSSDMMYTAIYSTLQGAYPVCSFNLGGYDYHGTTAQSSDAKEAAIGTIIGNIIMMARSLKKPTLIFLTSDGSVQPTGFTDVASPTGTVSRWAGDDNNYVCSAMFFVKGGSVNPSHLQTQLGNVASDTGLSNTTSFVGTDKLTTAAFLANWASLNNLPLSALDPVLQQGNFAQAVIDNIKKNSLCFG